MARYMVEAREVYTGSPLREVPQTQEEFAGALGYARSQRWLPPEFIGAAIDGARVTIGIKAALTPILDGEGKEVKNDKGEIKKVAPADVVYSYNLAIGRYQTKILKALGLKGFRGGSGVELKFVESPKDLTRLLE